MKITKLEADAFDWADENCRCCDDEYGYCEANGMRKGYEAGFRAARQMAAERVERCDTRSEDILKLGEEESDDDKN